MAKLPRQIVTFQNWEKCSCRCFTGKL